MKNKGTAAVLALLLGGLGAHKFYLDRAGAGIMYLLFCWTFIPLVLSIIDLVILLMMSEEVFNATYNPLFVQRERPQSQQISQNIVIQTASPAPMAQPQMSSRGNLSMAEELQKLNELRISGALTEEEFTTHKQKLLSM